MNTIMDNPNNPISPNNNLPNATNPKSPTTGTIRPKTRTRSLSAVSGAAVMAIRARESGMVKGGKVTVTGGMNVSRLGAGGQLRRRNSSFVSPAISTCEQVFLPLSSSISYAHSLIQSLSLVM